MTSKNPPSLSDKTAMEKIAWTELLVSATAITLVLILLPFLGDRAASAFGFLGLIGFSLWFVRGRKQKIIVDERDLEIERNATMRGVVAAWMFLMLALIVMVLWTGSGERSGFVAKGTLNRLIWIQFAIYLGVKGLVAVISYRRQARVA